MRSSPVACSIIALAILNPQIGLANPGSHDGNEKANIVIVHKSERRLQLKRNDDILHTYRIALGWAPEGHKRQEGDGRTPEGTYTLDWRNSDSQFYRSIHISYPEERDLAGAARWGISAGGMIMIHGLPNKADPTETENHHQFDWTDGCIAVTNAEIDEIWSDVEDGTPIIIFP